MSEDNNSKDKGLVNKKLYKRIYGEIRLVEGSDIDHSELIAFDHHSHDYDLCEECFNRIVSEFNTLKSQKEENEAAIRLFAKLFNKTYFSLTETFCEEESEAIRQVRSNPIIAKILKELEEKN